MEIKRVYKAKNSVFDKDFYILITKESSISGTKHYFVYFVLKAIQVLQISLKVHSDPELSSCE